MDRSAAVPSSQPTPPAPAAPLARAARFVWLTARVLEQRLFAYHFQAPAPSRSRPRSTAYLHADGGYGHALEPDLRGPVSQPLHAAHALRVLDGIGRCGGQRVERMCRYLTAISTRGRRAARVHPVAARLPGRPLDPAVADHPRGDLLTTGPVVGLLHRNEVWHAWLFRATDFCWAAVTALEEGAPHVRTRWGRPSPSWTAPRTGRAPRRWPSGWAAGCGSGGWWCWTPSAPRTCPLPPGLRPRRAHLVYDFARTPGSLARALVHRRRGGALAGLPGGRAAGGRRLAGPAAGLGPGGGAGVAAGGDRGGAAHPARLWPGGLGDTALTCADGPLSVGAVHDGGMARTALRLFSPATRGWFTGAFSAPTAAQEGAWQAIGEGSDVLVVAPTGSGKTLAAFLAALDRLAVRAAARRAQASAAGCCTCRR